MSEREQQVGKPVERNEDQKLLTGTAQFVDDVHREGMLHIAFLRSDYAHARIQEVDTSSAEEMEGVHAVYSAEDLGSYWMTGPLLLPPPPEIERKEFHEHTQPILARDKIRHMGEPVAAVVAESRYRAEDAVEQIELDVDRLDAAVDLEEALKPDSTKVHDESEGNLAAHVIQEKGNYEQGKKQADVLVQERFRYDRGAAAAIENRGIVADWNEKTRQLKVWDTTQAPIPIRNGLADMLDLSQSQVQVIAPFIGGGFGPKIMMFYPEEMLVPWISRQLERPVKWIEDRQENFFATTQEREQIHDAEMALTEDGRILGVHDEFLHDTGAYDPYGLTVPINSQCTLLGCYDVPNYYSEFRAVFTNKPIVTPVRGAGRQHGIFVMERLLDFAAQKLDLDPAEIRRRNFLEPDDFPHNHEIIYQDFQPLEYDSGNYEPALDKAVEALRNGESSDQTSSTKQSGRDEQAQAPDDRLHGQGIVTYVEGTGIGPYEGARVTVESTGEICVATGVGTQGQGHFTSFAQLVADQLGVDVQDVHLVTGDTKEFRWGTGTFASRGAAVAGNACHEAARKVRQKILDMGTERWSVSEDQLVLSDGELFVKEQPDQSVPFGTLAEEANPLRGGVDPDAQPGLEATAYYGPEKGSTANGVHAMEISLDPETAMVDIERYVVVHDCGTIINPMIVEGQIHGGVAMGIGNSFYEELDFDSNGQLRNASFMDYLVPLATDVPRIETDHLETPSPFHPLGVKGVGEAGAIPTAACFAQAVEDALSDEDVRVTEIPLSPDKLFTSYLQQDD